MSQDIVQYQQSGAVVLPGHSVPVAASGAVNAGAVSIEQQRAIAEAQGQLVLAKQFPRDLQAAYAELMDACKLPALAEVAFYSLPRGKNTVTGPSIRLAEEIARVYGNFQYGHRELSRDDKKSEVEVYAWDMEKNNYSKRQITVMHVLDTKDGPRKLRDQKDIDDKIANVASKQVRGRILALVPKWLSEAAIIECRKTLAGDNDLPISDRVRKMTQAFAKSGVTAKHLETYLGHSLAETTVEDLADLHGVFNAIRDGSGKISDYFGESDAPEATNATAQALTKAAHEGVQQRKQAQKQSTSRQPKQQQPEVAETEIGAGQSAAETTQGSQASEMTSEPSEGHSADSKPESQMAEEPQAGGDPDNDDVF